MSKEMSVTIKENWRSQIFDFLWKKIWRNALALKKKGIHKVYLGKQFWYYRL